MKGIGIRNTSMTLFLPYLSASHPPGARLRRLRTLEPVKKRPMFVRDKSIWFFRKIGSIVLTTL